MRETEFEPRPHEVWVSRISLVVAIIAVIAFILSVVPSPYVIMRPGPTVDVLGEAQIESETVSVIASPDSERYESDGVLRLVTVSLTGSPEHPASWLKTLQAFFDPSQSIVSMRELYPDQTSEEDRAVENDALMDASQMQAAAAAFAALGDDVPVVMTVQAVAENGPAGGVLEEGDVILEVDGDPVPDFTVLRQRIIESGEGRELEITVERAGERVALGVTPRLPEDGEAPMIGASIASEYELPQEVSFELDDVGGPSAGLVFALGLYELLTPGTLLDGRAVSVTGTIDAQGNVGGIGGIIPKIWWAERDGSELFLMPAENCPDLEGRLPDGLTIAPVDTLDEAIDVLEGQAPIRSCR